MGKRRTQDPELQTLLARYERIALRGGQIGLLYAIDGLKAMAEALERRWLEGDYPDVPPDRWIA